MEQYAPIVTVLLPVLVAIASGGMAWIAGRRTAAAKAYSDVQITINTSFAVLITELRGERQFLREQIKELELKISMLELHVMNLEQAIVAFGARPPPRPEPPHD